MTLERGSIDPFKSPRDPPLILSQYQLANTVYVDHLVDIKFGDLGANTGKSTLKFPNLPHLGNTDLGLFSRQNQ